MDRIEFVFEETNERVDFCVITSTQMNDIAYLLVVEEEALETDDPTAYILKAVAIDGDNVIYELVDDEEELSAVSPRFDELLEQTEFEVE